MKIKPILFALTISLFAYNCSSDSNEDLEENNNTTEQGTDDTSGTDDNSGTNDTPTARVTYNNTVRSIMSNNCTRCHGTPLANGAPFPLVTFDQVSGRALSVIARMNNMAAPMPPNGLVNTSIRAQMDQWRTDGLLEN